MRKIIIPLTILAAFNSIGQEAKPSDRKIIFKIETGFVTQTSFQLSNDTWSKAMPQFKLPDSLDTYQYKSFGPHIRNTKDVQTISVDFTYNNNFLAAKKIQASVGFILGYGAGSYIQDSYERRTSIPYDTLVSQQTGMEYPFAKTSYEMYNRSYISRDILIGIGNHYATNPDKIVSFSTGIELIYSMSVSQRIYGGYSQINVIEQEGASDPNQPYNPYYNSNNGLHDPNNPNAYDGSWDYQSAKGPTMHTFYGRIPLEISFRLGVKDNYWGKSRLGASITPSITYSIMDKNHGTQFSNWMGVNYRLTI